MKELPIACLLTPGDLRARREELLPGLMAHARQRVERPDGFAWRFEARSDVLQAIASIVVTGPAGTREFLDGFQQA